MNNCIFRYNENNGISCNTPTVNMYYCTLHCYTKHKIYNYIKDLSFPYNKEIRGYEVLLIYIYLYNKIFDLSERIKIMKPLFGKTKRLFSLSNELCIFTCKSSKKKKILIELINKLEWYCLIKDLKWLNRRITKIQLLWKKYMKYLSGFNLDILKCINTEDIFNLDIINSLEYPFYILDNQNIYCFETKNIYNFILNSGLWNPYTRNLFLEIDFIRLKKFIYIKNIPLLDKIIWLTPLQAYTDVILKFAENGFLINIDWLTVLQFKDILRIINLYHIFSESMPLVFLSDEHFLENNIYPHYIFTFCTMLMELLNNTDDDFYFTYICLLYKSFIYISKPFRENAPLWLLEIDYVLFIEIDFII
jgi:hypothetical protein